MEGSRLMCMFLVLVMVVVIHVGTAEISGFSSYQWRPEALFQSSVDIKEMVDAQMKNDTGWEALEVIADQIRSDRMRGVKQIDVNLFHLWRRLDDALSATKLQDGRIKVWIHIADPASFVEPGSLIDREALQRGTSVFLPTTTYPMFAEKLAMEGMSLKQGTNCRAVTVSVVLRSDGSIAEYAVNNTIIRPTYMLTYESASELLHMNLEEELELRTLAEAASLRLQWRRGQGAIQTGSLEPRIKVENPDDPEPSIRLYVEDQTDPAIRLVSEMMILCGEALATFGYSNKIHLPYRGLPQSKIDTSAYDHLPEGPVRSSAIVKLMRAAETDYIKAIRHGILGIPGYVQFTSPIRRYMDLLAHYQVKAFLRGDALPFTSGQVEGMATSVNINTRIAKKLSSSSLRYWILEYLRRQPKQRKFRALILKFLKDRHASLLLLEYKSILRSSRLKPAEIVKEIEEALTYMTNVDSSINTIGLLLFGRQKGRSILHSVRDPRVPVVDDWKCDFHAVFFFFAASILRRHVCIRNSDLTRSSRLCYMLFVLAALVLPATADVVDAPHANKTWEVLEIVANRIDFDKSGSLRQKDVYRFYLWGQYRSSSRSERVETVKETRELFTHLAYLDRTMDMIGMLLFGPENSPSILRSASRNSQNDDWQCQRSSMVLFEKHCALLSEHATRHPRFFTNICNNVVVKTSIEDAFTTVCGRDDTPYGIDVRNRHIDITPKPIGSSQSSKNVEYCERVLIRGISRMALGSYAKLYRVLVIPSLPRFNKWYKSIQICLHRDASLGLCMCKKDDWRSMRKALWSSVISPYEQNFVDVKFVGGVSGYVSVTLDEVFQGWRYAMLAVSTVHFCLTLHYAISFFKRRDNELIFQTSSQEFYSTFHRTPTRQNFSETETERRRELDELTERSTREAVSQLVSSPEFTDWLINKSRFRLQNDSDDDSESEVDEMVD